MNPYATKQAKELDDNSQRKSDKKDALTIAKLVKDGRYFELHLPHDIYAEFQGLSTTKTGLNKRKNALKNTIAAVLDEFFPEYEEVFNHPLTGKASRQILKTCLFPKFIMELEEEGVIAEIKNAVKNSWQEESGTACRGCERVCRHRLRRGGNKLKLRLMLEEVALVEKQTEELEEQMEAVLGKTGYAKFLLSIKGIGVVT